MPELFAIHLMDIFMIEKCRRMFQRYFTIGFFLCASDECEARRISVTLEHQRLMAKYEMKNMKSDCENKMKKEIESEENSSQAYPKN